MKNVLFAAFLLVFALGGCEKEAVFSIDDGQVFCPVHFRLLDAVIYDGDCVGFSPQNQQAELLKDDSSLLFSKQLKKTDQAHFFWNEAIKGETGDPTIDVLDELFVGNWVDSIHSAGGFLKFEKVELEAGARFGLFLSPAQKMAVGPTLVVNNFGGLVRPDFEVFVAREADGFYSITARGGGKSETVGGVSDFSEGYFRIFHDADNGRVLLWATLKDVTGAEVAKIEINDAALGLDPATKGFDRYAMSFGTDLLPAFQADCAYHACQIRLKQYSFGAPYATVSDDFLCNSVLIAQ